MQGWSMHCILVFNYGWLLSEINTCEESLPSTTLTLQMFKGTLDMRNCQAAYGVWVLIVSDISLPLEIHRKAQEELSAGHTKDGTQGCRTSSLFHVWECSDHLLNYFLSRTVGWHLLRVQVAVSLQNGLSLWRSVVKALKPWLVLSSWVNLLCSVL